MVKKVLSFMVMLGILLLTACQNSASTSGSFPMNDSQNTTPSSSSVQKSSDGEISPASQDILMTSSVANIYRYDSIPAFPIPNVTPHKITYYKAMLGETTVILDTKQIEQVTELLSKVEVYDAPTSKGSDEELHQLISFYQDIDDEEPAYSLYFLVNSLYIEANGTCSDVYPTLNWINKGSDDEAKINVKFRKLIDSWAQPDFPPLPSS